MEHPIWKKLVAPLLVIALAFLTVNAQFRADAAKPVRKDELVYLPNEKLLTHFTAGMSSVIADMLWLRCVQYTGAEFKTEHNFAWLNQMLNTIVRLDPGFRDVYRYGAIFLSAVKADDAAGLDLLQRGIVQRPDAWELPYEAAMIFLLNRRDQPGSKRVAAHYLAMSVSTGKSPQFVAETAAAIQGEANLDDLEGEMWANLQKNGDKVLRELAERKQVELSIRKNLGTLNDNLARFQQETGRPATSIDEMLDRGYFGPKVQADHTIVINDPLGGHYFLSPHGTALNTTLLDNAKEKALNALRESVKRYHDAKGAYPPTLDQLIPEYRATIDPHPYPNQDWTYNPLTGEVSG